MKQNKVQSSERLVSKKRLFLKLALAFTLAGLVFIVTAFVVNLALIRICPAAGQLCDTLPQPLLISFFLGISAATGLSLLILQVITKSIWWVSLTIILCGALTLYVFLGSLATILQFDIAPSYMFWAVGGVIFLFNLYGFLFWYLRGRIRLAVITALAIFTVNLSMMFFGQGLLRDLHTSYGAQKDAKYASTLSFTLYAPSSVPTKFKLTTITVIPAYHESPANYALTYSNQPITRTAGAHSLYITQEAIHPDFTNICAQPHVGFQQAPLGACEPAVTTNRCKVHTQFPSVDAQNVQAFCQIGDTRIKLTYSPEHLTQDELLKLFDSLKPADFTTLFNEAQRNNNLR